MVRTAADIGRASRAKGIRSELDLAKFLRCWWPGAERKVDNGWRSGARISADHGDIRGTPRLVWQLKARADMTDKQISDALAETATQAVAAGADYGILVERRPGKADAGRWWAWLPIGDIVHLGTRGQVDVLRRCVVDIPVRLELRCVVALLLASGYGTASEK